MDSVKSLPAAAVLARVATVDNDAPKQFIAALSFLTGFGFPATDVTSPAAFRPERLRRCRMVGILGAVTEQEERVSCATSVSAYFS